MANYSTKWLKVSEPFPSVLHVELARSPVNAISPEFWREYGQLFDSLSRDGYDVRALVLSSTIPKVFTAGIDFTDYTDGSWGKGDDFARAAFGTRKALDEFHHIVRAPERAPFPVIVALHGHVVGMGVSLIGACDIRYAASNTVFSLKEIDLGFAPDVGALAFLPKITSNVSLIRELTYTGRPFSATEAEKLGLLSKVVQGGRDEVIQEALGLAKLIATKSPVGMASAKHLISHSLDHSVAENLSYTSVWSFSSLTKDIEQAFSPKQTPNFAPLTLQTSSKL